MYKRINLDENIYTLIDDDMQHLNNFKWYCRNGYAIRTDNDNRVAFRLHREILGVTDENIHVDHINGNSLDNRKCNLRICTAAENAKNVRNISVTKTSKFKGVSKHKNKGKWVAQISNDKEKIYLGIFDTEEAAAKAYDNAAIIYHKEFESSNHTIQKSSELDWEEYEILSRAQTVQIKNSWRVRLDNGMIFDSIELAANYLNVKPNTIVKACTDKSRVRKCRGYIVEYIEQSKISVIY